MLQDNALLREIIEEITQKPQNRIGNSSRWRGPCTLRSTSHDPKILISLGHFSFRDGSNRCSVPDENNTTTFFYSTNMKKTKLYLELNSRETTRWWVHFEYVQHAAQHAEEGFEDDEDMS